MPPYDINTTMYRIVKQPPDHFAHVAGEVGFLIEIARSFGQIQTLHIDGRSSGCGVVPLDCLEPVHESVWVRAKTLYDARQAELQTAYETYQVQCQSHMARLVEKYHLPEETIRAIQDDRFD